MKINLTIDNVRTTANPNDTILEVAKKIGKTIPTLCHIEGLTPNGACRICIVEDNGNLVPSCATPVREGMDIKTNTPRILNARKGIIEMLLAAHPNNCTTCFKANNCDLSDLARIYAIEKIRIPEGFAKRLPDNSNPSIVREPEKCILCGKCVRVCSEIQGVGAIDFVGRGADTTVSPSYNLPLGSTQCTFCGQCINVCPTGALHENPHIDKVLAALRNPDKLVVVQTAPAIRVSIGELFGMAPGNITTGKLAAALRLAGFDKVVDTNFGADLTIMEEGSELVQRIKENGPFPLLTSCSPGWIKYIEHTYSEFLPNLSTAKSPQGMTGAVIKNIWAKRENIDPKNVYVVGIMPCTAKKYEASRPELGQGTISDVDAVLTTREAGLLLRQLGVDFKNVPEGDFDHPLGASTGAAAIFGRSGGVMEAALRSAYYLITGEESEKLSWNELGGEGIRESEIVIEGITLKVATVSGLKGANDIMERIKAGEVYHFIEVMACPGGCINGGGQPYADSNTVKLRMDALNIIDKNFKIRQSHNNPEILELYRDYLGKPLSHESHKLLHTHYYKRDNFSG